MKSILPEFMGSMERIHNNFFFSFLALNFLNLRPFSQSIILSVDMAKNIITSESLNSFDIDGVQEYGNSIRRHFLNDMVITYERYSVLMIASHHNAQRRTDPCKMNDRSIGAHRFEQLRDVYLADEVEFFVQVRRLRNSIVHYNGIYNASNVLKYAFGNECYDSAGNEGQNISIKFDNLLWIYEKLLDTVQRGNARYFVHHTKVH